MSWGFLDLLTFPSCCALGFARVTPRPGSNHPIPPLLIQQKSQLCPQSVR